MPKHDPLEEAKIDADGGKKKKKPRREDEADAAPLPPPPPRAAPPPPPVAAAAPPPLPTLPDVPGLPKSKTGMYRVKAERRVSWYGQMTTLAKGAEVSLRSYGADGMKRLLEQGVEFEPDEG